MTTLEGWLSATEAAQYLGISRPRIHQLARLGVLDTTRIAGRLLVHLPSLDMWASGRGYRRAWRPRNLRELRFKRPEILQLAADHGASNVRVFGSVARGDAGPSSDIDLAVDLDPTRSALDVAEFAVDLEDSLGCPVDIVVTSGPYGASVNLEETLADAVPL